MLTITNFYAYIVKETTRRLVAIERDGSVTGPERLDRNDLLVSSP